MNMPEMNGLECALKIRALKKNDISIYITTGDSCSSMMTEHIEKGIINGVIMKPISKQEIVDIAHGHIRL